MYSEETMKKLQVQMYEMHEKYGTLIHPYVVKASQQLDKMILEYYRPSKTA